MSNVPSNAEMLDALRVQPPGAREPHPIDRALAALADAIALVLASGKASRFAEIARLTTIAHKLGSLRPAGSVDDVHADAGAQLEDENGNLMGAGPIMLPARGFNDGADLNRQMLMMAQSFLREYADIEKAKLAKKPAVTEGRLLEVSELSELFELRMKLSAAGQEVPAQIGQRIDYLLKQIGEPSPGIVEQARVEEGPEVVSLAAGAS